MSTRTYSPFLALILTACGSPDTASQGVPPSATAATPRVADEGRIACARGGEDFAQTCTAERTAGPDGVVVTVRDAAGGFRRLRVVEDGRGVVAADGAEPVTVSPAGADEIEVAVGGDRYRLPATTKAATPAR